MSAHEDLISLEDGESILYTQINVTLAASDEHGGVTVRGAGKLMVTNRRVFWAKDTDDSFEF